MHKEFHEVAYCEEQRGASAVHYGRIPSSKVSVKKLIRQFELESKTGTKCIPLHTKMPVLFSPGNSFDWDKKKSLTCSCHGI